MAETEWGLKAVIERARERLRYEQNLTPQMISAEVKRAYEGHPPYSVPVLEAMAARLLKASPHAPERPQAPISRSRRPSRRGG